MNTSTEYNYTRFQFIQIEVTDDAASVENASNSKKYVTGIEDYTENDYTEITYSLTIFIRFKATIYSTNEVTQYSASVSSDKRSLTKKRC